MIVQECTACGNSVLDQIHGVWVCPFCGSTYIADFSCGQIRKKLTGKRVIELYQSAQKKQLNGDFQGERDVLSRALELDNSNQMTLQKIAESCFRSQKYNDALNTYSKMLLINPYHGTAHVFIGVILAVKSEWTRAEVLIERGLSFMDRESAEYWKCYAYSAILTEHRFNRERANEVLKQAEEHGFQDSDRVRALFPSGGVDCYIATCVYGSYDCPQVWTLRRFRDNTLAATWYGRAFIRCYYAVSPTLVRLFGETRWFRSLWKKPLDKLVASLRAKGVQDTPYYGK